MLKTIGAVTALALLATTTSGVAADLGPYGARKSTKDFGAPSYAPAFSWSGFYLGLQAGYGWGTTEASTGTVANLNQAYSYDSAGALGGVHAGFNWQAQQLVLGIETDLELSGLDGSGLGTQGSRHSSAIDWTGSFRGRAGFAADRTLFYLTGGLAYGDIAATGPDFTTSDWRTGWTLGGGIEHAFGQNWTARLEYRYTDLGSDKFSSTGINRAESNDVSFSAIRAGLSWKF